MKDYYYLQFIVESSIEKNNYIHQFKEAIFFVETSQVIVRKAEETSWKYSSGVIQEN